MDTESYQRFGIGWDAIAERGTITPITNRVQHDLIFVRAAAIQDESAVHVSVGPNNEADAHAQIVVFRSQQWIRG